MLIADDHPLFREGVARSIRERPDLELVAAAEDGRGALAAIREHRPDVAVLDVRMPGLDGLEVLRAVRRDELPTRVLMLSAFAEAELVYRAIELGASGYLSKDAGPDAVLDGIAGVARGDTVLAPEMQAAVFGEIRSRAGADQKLSPRESEILALVAEGLAVPDIATRLHLGQGTVKTHLQRIYEKLGVSDRAAAVAAAMRAGLLE